jgi:hypothetical protein
MPNKIDNAEDMIDSRDVIARIEELQEQRMPWSAGWNMPGYMPDNDPAVFADWSDAQTYILDELHRYLDETDDETEQTDIRATIDRLANATEDNEFGETVGKYHFWLSHQGANAGLDADEIAELASLEKLAKQGEDYAPDWQYGETLIRYSYFTEYVQELLEDCGDISKNIPHYVMIDWDATARNVMVDYTHIDFDGVTYLIR